MAACSSRNAAHTVMPGENGVTGNTLVMAAKPKWRLFNHVMACLAYRRLYSAANQPAMQRNGGINSRDRSPAVWLSQ